MPEPQSTEFFLILITAFGLLAWWLAVARHLVLRILAACLAFVPAVGFGVAAVNKYYDYYQTWGAAASDLTGSGAPAAAPRIAGQPGGPSGMPSGAQFGTFLGQAIDTRLAAAQGFTLRLRVAGAASGIRRTVYVFLPPEYFRAAWRSYRFPVIELIHGFPGGPQDWITVLNVTTTLDSLVAARQAQPAVLVMPDANGGTGISLQCLNAYRGPQDDTYLSQDLPGYLATALRVRQPGRGWGIAGYSEGGFCAANLGLRHGQVFSAAGVLSGYFIPGPDVAGSPPRQVSPFASPVQRALNSPMYLARSLPARQPIARFWLGAGSGDGPDLRSAEMFRQLLELRQPQVPLSLAPGGGHTMFTWRLLLPQLLRWMTTRLAAVPAGPARDPSQRPAPGG